MNRFRKRAAANGSARILLRHGNCESDLRVFYEQAAGDTGRVNILAIGVKKGNRLLIAGEEMHL